MNKVPFDCQIKILQNLSCTDIEKISSILPSWKHACTNISLWRNLLKRDIKQTPVLDSNQAEFIFSHLFYSEKSTQEVLARKVNILENTISNHSIELEKWRQNESSISDSVHRFYNIFKKILRKQLQISIWGPGIESKGTNDFISRFLWNQQEKMKCLGMTEHGGLKLKFEQS